MISSRMESVESRISGGVAGSVRHHLWMILVIRSSRPLATLIDFDNNANDIDDYFDVF